MRAAARLLRQRYGVHTGPARVRMRKAWYWRVSRALALLVLLGGLGWWLFELGHHAAEVEHAPRESELTRLKSEAASLSGLVKRMRADNEELMGEIARITHESKVDLAAQADLKRSVSELQGEIGRLKEELAFFQNIMATDSDRPKVDVYEFKVKQSATPEEYHYLALLFQAGPRDKAFRGKVELVLNLEQQGKQAVQTISASDGRPGAAEVSFKYYHRLEGMFKIPAGARLQAVQLRLFEPGHTEPKLVRSANLS